jgi:hypothetical protein
MELYLNGIDFPPYSVKLSRTELKEILISPMPGQQLMANLASVNAT